MTLQQYFEVDDGSLPEIVVDFHSPNQVRDAFAFLFRLGGKDITAGGAALWNREEEKETEFRTPDDFELVFSGAADPFHLVLRGLESDGVILPDLGVFVDPHSMVLDYRMGAEWGDSKVASFIAMLRELVRLGGTITVPWWGAEGEQAFREAITNI
ncbi:hypothetical protein ACFQUU_15170 [Herbaspirillum sp. GCM10030257]|uniref:hypothetical protein n=1 Tax=Herbaspirillum sp. GCM10030257 TaxID=3273393 RepID=UPI0036068EF4